SAPTPSKTERPPRRSASSLEGIMAFENQRSARCIALAMAISISTAACASNVRRFPLRDPMWHDTDTAPVATECHPDAKRPPEKDCSPMSYESSLAWDAADNAVFRPMSKALAVSPGGEAVNVNSFDEVPDSSWFENRIGVHELSAEAVGAGFCGGSR